MACSGIYHALLELCHEVSALPQLTFLVFLVPSFAPSLLLLLSSSPPLALLFMWLPSCCHSHSYGLVECICSAYFAVICLCICSFLFLLIFLQSCVHVCVYSKVSLSPSLFTMHVCPGINFPVLMLLYRIAPHATPVHATPCVSNALISHGPICVDNFCVIVVHLNTSHAMNLCPLYSLPRVYVVARCI